MVKKTGDIQQGLRFFHVSGKVACLQVPVRVGY
jgi:hypothetical protein